MANETEDGDVTGNDLIAVKVAWSKLKQDFDTAWANAQNKAVGKVKIGDAGADEKLKNVTTLKDLDGFPTKAKKCLTKANGKLDLGTVMEGQTQVQDATMAWCLDKMMLSVPVITYNHVGTIEYVDPDSTPGADPKLWSGSIKGASASRNNVSISIGGVSAMGFGVLVSFYGGQISITGKSIYSDAAKTYACTLKSRLDAMRQTLDGVCNAAATLLCDVGAQKIRTLANENENLVSESQVGPKFDN